jgi:hypothetical protein
MRSHRFKSSTVARTTNKSLSTTQRRWLKARQAIEPAIAMPSSITAWTAAASAAPQVTRCTPSYALRASTSVGCSAPSSVAARRPSSCACSPGWIPAHSSSSTCLTPHDTAGMSRRATFGCDPRKPQAEFRAADSVGIDDRQCHRRRRTGNTAQHIDHLCRRHRGHAGEVVATRRVARDVDLAG